MQFAVISDTHDNQPNLDKALRYLKTRQITQLLHCGDICQPEILEHMARHFIGKIFFVYGNNDLNRAGFAAVVKQYPHIKALGEVGTVTLDSRQYALTHYPREAERLALMNVYAAVFYGHTHTPWEKRLSQTLVLNPGTLGGMFQKATFAVFDAATQQAELVVLEKVSA